MAGSPQASWASGAPKWAAIVVLGSAAIAGVAWSMGREGQVWRPATQQKATASPPVATPAMSPQASTQTGAAQPSATEAAPTKPSPKPDPPPATPSLRKLININTAGQGELELLPGVGPKLAQRIIDYRTAKGPFKRVDDLDAVKGIGPKTMARLRELITVE